MSPSRTIVEMLLAAALLLGGGGCIVGPNYHAPAAPPDAGYTPALLPPTAATPGVAGGGAQAFVPARDIPGDWWTVFQSKPLDDLIEQSLKNNPNLAAAQAALQAAKEAVLARRGYFYPNLSAGLGVSESKSSAQLSPETASGALTYSLYTPEVTVAYVPDVFGGNRRQVEALQAQAEQQRDALAAADIALSANVVEAVIAEASLRGQIVATAKLIDINTGILQVLRDQFAQGYVSRLDVAQQESQLAQVEATLPPLQKQLDQERDLLAALAGGFPNQPPAGMFEFADLKLPDELPLSLPPQLVEQRPDVLLAESDLRAASAQVGVAVANRLPAFDLTADAGVMAVDLSRFFSGTGIWSLGAAVAQPIYDGGTLQHERKAAQAAFEEAGAQYRATVQAAFENVADTLHALEQDAEALHAAAAAADAAQISLNIARQQLQSGYADTLTVLNAEQAYQQAALNLVQAQTNRYADTAALYLALGGGWWHRPEIPH